MRVKKLIVGPLATNCYILIDNNDCLIIDPGDDYEIIKNEIGSLNVLAILITHYHFDHIGALEKLKQDYDVSIYDYKMKENKYKINNFKFEIIYTPGHKDDAVTFYFKENKLMFVGDFIFKNSIGRTDLETGDFKKMQESLKRIKNYNDDIELLPGHGNSTVLGIEKQNNYYLRNI